MSKRGAVKTQATNAPSLTSIGALQRKCASCGDHKMTAWKCVGCEKNEGLSHRKSNRHSELNEVPPIVYEVLRSPGQPLDAGTRALFEPRFGHDFSNVKVHTDGEAAESARAVNALAYTVGQDIVFSAAQYLPGSAVGQRLLAHELAHVVQQGLTTAAVNSIQFASDLSGEANANAAAETVLAGQRLAAVTETAPALQRQTAPDAIGGSDDEPCKPYRSYKYGSIVWAELSQNVPGLTATFTGCDEVKPVWKTYFAATSAPFSFFNPSSCVVSAAKVDPGGSKAANSVVKANLQDIIDYLLVTLRSVTPRFLSLGGPIAELRLPLEEAIGPHGPRYLHPEINYNDPYNAAANIAGGVGAGGQGSDVFGDDDRIIGGLVIIEVNTIDPTSGMMSGQVRWQPHIYVKDTADFCPGNLGNWVLRTLTVPMSKLEAMGLTRDVPLTIDYDLDVQQANFNVVPLIGPLPPLPGPPPPMPTPKTFPRSGPAKTTGSLLRIRAGPGLRFQTLGLLGERGAPILVITQVHGDLVDGNDIWNKIAEGYVSDRFVAFDTDS